MKKHIKHTILTCTLAYILTIASVLLVTTTSMLVFGLYISFVFFTLTLVTFRLYEIHQIFIMAPPIVAIVTMLLLSKTRINKRILAGLSMTIYYVVVTLIFLIMRAEEFPYEILIIWIPWVFILGALSSVIVDKLNKKISMKT